MTYKKTRKPLAEIACLQRALRRAREHNEELREANANLRVERDTADDLLGAAMDELLGQAR